MKKLFLLIISCCLFSAVHAFTLPEGTFYFDNSVTQFKNVKFVYGNETTRGSFIVSLEKVNDRYWKLTNKRTVTNLYRYTFAETSLQDGRYNVTFPTLKDNISLERGEVRTATTDKEMTPGWTYVSEDNENRNWYQGYWKYDYDPSKPEPEPIVPIHPNCKPQSNTLPIVYLSTNGNKPIESKEVYLPGSLYVDALSIPGYTSLGSATNPIPLQVKGRGNYTWLGFDKKPYRIKFTAKQSMLNMPADKSYTLLAHADDDLAFLRNTTGFALSKYFELAYTPRQEPVELFINRQYQGVYMLTEHIKASKNRVNIIEQMDYDADPTHITGGWLLEIDNYREEEQIVFWENEMEEVWVTYKSPDYLCTAQYDYMYHFLQDADWAIYHQADYPTAWENYIDVNSLVDFYIIQEIMNNRESFHGSCYMHKQRGNDTKLVFGPVWDFGNSYRDLSEEFIYENPPYGDVWISEIAKFPRFQQLVQQRWAEKRGNLMPYLKKEINRFIGQIQEAAVCDCKKWPDYGTKNAQAVRNEFYDLLNDRLSWLDSHWGTVGIETITAPQVVVSPNPTQGVVHLSSIEGLTSVQLFDLSGRLLQTESPALTLHLNVAPGTYLLRLNSADGAQTIKLLVK